MEPEASETTDHFEENSSDEDNEDSCILYPISSDKTSKDFKESGNEYYKEKKDFQEAYNCYQQGILAYERDCEDDDEFLAILHSNSAASLIQLGKYEKALKECDKALEIDDKNVKVLYRRACVHEKLNDFVKAYADLKSIIELHKDHIYALRKINMIAPKAKEQQKEQLNKVLGDFKKMGKSILSKFGINMDNIKFNTSNGDGKVNISYGDDIKKENTEE